MRWSLRTNLVVGHGALTGHLFKAGQKNEKNEIPIALHFLGPFFVEPTTCSRMPFFLNQNSCGKRIKSRRLRPEKE
jgi:hypothetical protein